MINACKLNCSIVSNSLQPRGLYPTRLLCPCLGFSRQEYWSGWPFPTPRDIPNRGINPAFPAYPVFGGMFFLIEPPWKPYIINTLIYKWNYGL